MTLKITPREHQGVAILDLAGRITIGENSAGLREAINGLVAKGSKKILLNLHDVDYIDSTGIGTLASAFTSVRRAGGELKLLNLTHKVKDLLQITKLYTVFDVQNDEAKALAAFG